MIIEIDKRKNRPFFQIGPIGFQNEEFGTIPVVCLEYQICWKIRSFTFRVGCFE